MDVYMFPNQKRVLGKTSRSPHLTNGGRFVRDLGCKIRFLRQFCGVRRNSPPICAPDVCVPQPCQAIPSSTESHDTIFDHSSPCKPNSDDWKGCSSRS